MKELFSSAGRYNRLKYWKRTILFSAIYVLVVVILFSTKYTYAPSIALYLTLPYLLIMFFVVIRRLHDLNMGGGFALFAFVPIGNICLFISLGFIKGSDGLNNYDDNPRGDKIIKPMLTGHEFRL